MRKNQSVVSARLCQDSKGKGQKEGFARDPIFGGSCIPKFLPLEDNPITIGVTSSSKYKKSQKWSSIK